MSRRRRIALLASLAALATASAGIARGDAEGIRVAQAAARFPHRALVLTLPRKLALDAASVEVRENGSLVGRREVVAGRSSRRIGVVLVLDASNSMRGRPIADAISAARAFAAERSAGQRLGLVTFNARSHVVLRPTTDAAAIERALESVKSLALGTTVRDAALGAVDVLRRSRVEAGSVVLLSDGADTRSEASTADVVAAARRAHVRIFAVGLRSSQFAPGPLRALADGSGGLYSEARTSARLSAIYRALGERLAREYLIHYTSQAEPGRHVYVTVRVPALGAAGTAGLDYVAPAAPTATVGRSVWQRVLLSPASILTVTVVAAIMAALAAYLAVRAARRPLTIRMTDFVEVGDLARDPQQGPDPLAQAERALSRFHAWQRLAADAEIAQIRQSPTVLGVTAGVVSFLIGPLAATATGQPLLLVLAVVPPLAVRAWVNGRLSATRRAFGDQLPDSLQMLASALRAGHGMSGALAVVATDAQQPTRRELERALSDARIGTPLEDSLNAIAKRMESGDLEQVALVAAVHRETGGNTAEVIDRVHDTVRERAELRRTVRALTAQGRMARWILTALPVAVGLIASLLVPDYMGVLYETLFGQVLLVVSAAMVVVGSLIVKQLVEIEV